MQQMFDEVRADEACTAGHQNGFRLFHLSALATASASF